MNIISMVIYMRNKEKTCDNNHLLNLTQTDMITVRGFNCNIFKATVSEECL